MTLGNIFSAQDIAALKAVATASANTTKKAYIQPHVWEQIYDVAAKVGQKLPNKFWDALDQQMRENGEAIICFKGKQEREIISVSYNAVFAKHLGRKLKMGYSIVWVGCDDWSTEITWSNWKEVYAELTQAPDTQKYDPEMTAAEKREMRITRKRQRMFNDGAEVIRRRKSMIPTTTEEAANQAYSVARDREFRAAAERDIAISPIVSLASKIFEMV